eukprot:365611-Chlamydomonas_euryale.AAC.7
MTKEVHCPVHLCALLGTRCGPWSSRAGWCAGTLAIMRHVSPALSAGPGRCSVLISCSKFWRCDIAAVNVCLARGFLTTPQLCNNHDCMHVSYCVHI